MKDDSNTENFDELEKAAAKLDDVPTQAADIPQMDTSEEIDAIEEMANNDDDFDDEDLTDVILATSDSVLKNYPELQITQGEASRLSRVWVRLINKWTKGNFKYKAELLAVAVTGVVIYPRYRVIQDARRHATLHNGQDAQRQNDKGTGTAEPV